MPVAFAFSFPAGRFHATAWGRHVNEGAPDWPPAPWRVLRALVAVWKRTLPHDDLVATHLPAALGQLTALPHYVLPPATLAHHRHYMPSEKQALVFDAFVALDTTAELGMVWPHAELSADERQAVARVLAHLNHLGRAEAWCAARLCAEGENLPGEPCVPVAPDTGEVLAAPPHPAETVRLLCPDPAQWNQWSYGRKAKRPEPLWNLLAETADLHAEGWSDPPGAQWVTYLRPAQALTPPPPTRRAPANLTRPRWVRFALDGPVLPRVTETVYVAELARHRVQGIFGRLFQAQASPVFSGKTPTGDPLPAHRHAFFLPSDDDRDGKLDHLTLFAADGFGPLEQAALDVWRETRGPGDMVLRLLWESQAEHGPQATRWRSATPFIPTRHYKERGTKRDSFPRDQLAEMNLREELARRGLPEPVSITRMKDLPLAGRPLAWRYFRQQRVFGEGRRGGDFGQGFTLEFAEPVAGPLAVGYACHYGLGLFLPTP